MQSSLEASGRSAASGRTLTRRGEKALRASRALEVRSHEDAFSHPPRQVELERHLLARQGTASGGAWRTGRTEDGQATGAARRASQADAVQPGVARAFDGGTDC